MVNPSKNNDVLFFDALEKLSRLMNVATRSTTTDRALSVVKRSMNLLEGKFRSLLEDENNNFDRSYNKFRSLLEAKRSDLVTRLRRIVSIMTTAGYGQECCDVFRITRAEKLSACLRELLDTSSEEHMKFENEITKWISVFRHMVHVYEHLLCNTILYMDRSLCYVIPIITNAHYILHNLSECSDIKEMHGDQWDRHISDEICGTYKNYPINTWESVLNCFKKEGLHVEGTSIDSVPKAVLKERLQSFYGYFEEITKRQSMRIIDDKKKKLQSYLRTVVHSLVVEGYRSFVGDTDIT